MSAASAPCTTCNHFANGHETSVTKAFFLASASRCQGCSIILKALDAVTDIRRPEFKTIKIRRKEEEGHWEFLNPKSVLHVQCEQEDAGEDYAIPWLGLRNGPGDRYREQSTNLEDRLNEARIWYEDCKANHPFCVPRKDGWPRRILDLTSDSVRLIDALCIIQDDVQDWMDQIPRMSSIYQGAELVISAQSASSVEEGFLSLTSAANAPLKRIEVPFRMPNGTSRIVKLSIREQEQQYFNIPAHHSSRPMVGENVSINNVLVPLTTRAWVFQENFLARRILYATPSELAWECSKHERCECHVSPRKVGTLLAAEYEDYGLIRTLGQMLRAEHQRAAGQPISDKMKLWAEVVRKYSERNLTRWTDRLAAIYGVVEGLAQTMPDKFNPKEDYLFGLWRPNLEKCMLWSRHPRTPGDSATAATLREIAPSWSWVTCVGGVEYYDSIFEPDAHIWTRVFRIEHIESAVSDTDVFGAGKCKLALFGLCIPVQHEPTHLSVLQEDAREEDYLEVPFLFPERYTSKSEWNFGPPVIDMIPDDPTDKTVFDRVTHFAPMVHRPPHDGEEPRPQIQGLFLERIGGPDEGKEPFNIENEGTSYDIKFEGTFKRVGFGYDYGSQVDLHWNGKEDYISEMRIFKLV
ncbi:hypothetical protein G6011_01106 [Alternaria panax]|uniref:Heterokaryon incompatibility domain-containing protein n=1 Tax=Alternaria panax TaxID=48097 RepID=A0AAD4NW78_9PLEO|nr:hypothetical protein G6011_01106 [Alternaria panax]